MLTDNLKLQGGDILSAFKEREVNDVKKQKYEAVKEKLALLNREK